MPVRVRAETAEDYGDVYRVNELAFGRPGEARLVEALRLSADPYISLVAIGDGGRLVGHILFSPVTVESDEASAFKALALGPMAVLPEQQGRGVGSQLIKAGLDLCLSIGHPLVFVVGHPDYYPRFGFRPARPLGFTCQYPVPDEAFMLAELEPGARDGRRGLVRYLPEFDGV